jgi:uncharacterized phage protein (TIGR01671 family)
MREIKFRAYVKFLNEIQNVVELFRSGKVITDGYDYALAHDDIILMQFTGLQDINGADIYEGDIVQSVDYYPSEIVYSEYKACFLAGDLVIADGGCYRTSNRWEVIGNIHENPELLEGNE